MENGLHVIFHLDKSDPVVAVELMVHVGSAREIQGRTGFAHLFEHLLFLESEDPEKEISLYINSPGGVVSDGLAIYDTMQFIQCPVSTLCFGQAASMGSFLLAAGDKGKRYSLPNSRIMVHQPSAGFRGQATDIEIHAKEVLSLKKRLNELYSVHTGQDVQAIETALERDNFMSAEDAKKFGIIDEIQTKRAPQTDIKPE